MSEYILGDEDHGGGPSGQTGCGILILIAAGAAIGLFFACKFGSGIFATVTGLF